MPSARKPAPAPKDPAAAEMRANAAAQKTISDLMPDVISILGASPAPGMPEHASVALPVGTGQTLIGALRNRPNWYAMARREIDRVARIVTERNWFTRPVHAMRLAVYSHGFQFSSAEARAWAGQGTYPFRKVAKDMIDEWLVSRAVIVWWRKNPTPGSLPRLHIPNAGDCEYDVIAGVPQISVTMQRRALPEKDKAIIGERMWTATRKGGKFVIQEGDPEFDFRVLKEGKDSSPLPVPPLVTILDDLDFVEAIRVGDWNGAKARWEIIRHTKKGYAVTSGNNAGLPRNNAKKEELKAILEAMKKILGKQDLVTNFDQEVAWLIFPKEHFHEDLLREVKQRLLFWSGVFGVLLLKTDSQITGLSAFLMDQLRAEVLAFREDFTEFLTEIFNSESFLAGMPSAPRLVPQWDVKLLYSAKALIELATFYSTYAIAAPQTVREMFGIDNEEAMGLFRQAHEDPQGYTPVFEPRQGITAAVVAPDSPTGNQNQNALPGEPGRPAEG